MAAVGGPASAAAPSQHLGAGLLLAAAGAVAFSGKAIIVKLAYRHGVDAVQLLMLRMLFALPLFLLLAWWAGRGQPALGRRAWLAVVGLGFSGYYLASFLDFLGLQYISASLERLILYLNPTFVLVLGWLLLGKRIGRGQALGMAISYAGIALVFGSELSLAGRNVLLGSVLVAASALSYAVYLIYSGHWVPRLGSLRLTGLASIVACLLCIGQFFALRPAASAFAVAPEVLWLSLLNATLCTVAPVVMLMKAIELVGAPLASQTGMLGPLSTLAMGVLILGEPFTPLLAVGTALVLAGVAWAARAEQRARRRAATAAAAAAAASASAEP